MNQAVRAEIAEKRVIALLCSAVDLEWATNYMEFLAQRKGGTKNDFEL